MLGVEFALSVRLFVAISCKWIRVVGGANLKMCAGKAHSIAPCGGLVATALLSRRAPPNQYLGILNATDMGNFSNHLVAVEFDTEFMYVGFSASTGNVLASSHYISGWSFKINGQARALDLSSLHSLPGQPKNTHNVSSRCLGFVPLSYLLFPLQFVTLSKSRTHK
ncbi:hypothetical protein V6N11_072302 [Hibiscus sabdariffa]|uniref:Legume lectin domain-containing protein n=1 Tax=Hibiscus sabdariffa TaxID=183260 RepID=A0ABR2U2X1_9ROSI